MRHIVDEIILHLRQFFLAEYDVNRKDERHQQYKSKYHRRYHKPDRIKDIILLSRKMYLDDTHTGRRIIQKQWLRIRTFTPNITIIRTTVYFSTLPVYHLKMIVHITETIFYQTSFKILVQTFEINTLFNRLVTGIIYHLQHNLIYQCTLVKIAIFKHLYLRA